MLLEIVETLLDRLDAVYFSVIAGYYVTIALR